MLLPNDIIAPGTHVMFNFEHYGLSVYGRDGAIADLSNAGVPITIIGVYEHMVGDITVDMVWNGNASTVQSIGEQMADAMSTWWMDIRIHFLNATLNQTESIVKPSEDINKSLDNLNHSLDDLFNNINNALPYIVVGVGILLFLNFGGASLVRGAFKK